jgi:hypothetical protein
MARGDLVRLARETQQRHAELGDDCLGSRVDVSMFSTTHAGFRLPAAVMHLLLSQGGTMKHTSPTVRKNATETRQLVQYYKREIPDF